MMAHPLSLTFRKSILYQLQSVYRIFHLKDPYHHVIQQNSSFLKQ